MGGGRVSSSDASSTTRYVYLPAAEDVLDDTIPDRTAANECDNRIITAKYTWWNFVPKSIFEQFRRVANFYFLVQLILMFIGQNKTLNAFVNDLSPAGTLVALALVILVTMVLHLKDDLGRHQKDKETNLSTVHLLQWAAGFGAEDEHAEAVAEDIPCQRLIVGDVILVKSGEEVPADAVVLASSEAMGVSHIETSNLDGETNLKRRRSIEATHQDVMLNFAEEGLPPGTRPSPEILARALRLKGIIQTERPNMHIHTFSGEFLPQTTTRAATPLTAARVPLTVDNLIIRGCRLRACSWVIAAVVYTGKQTKAAMNNSKPPSKLSRMEKGVNRFMAIAFCLQIVMIIISDVSNLAWYDANIQNNDTHMWYLNPYREERQLALPNWLAYFFTFFVLYNNMIPISMYVMMEIANFVHAAFINEDANMYKPEVDGKALCRSANLCQELGQIEYMFTDKTGTLTSNEMVFKMASIGGILYGSPDRPFDTGLMRVRTVVDLGSLVLVSSGSPHRVLLTCF